jgi:hypothetical protein
MCWAASHQQGDVVAQWGMWWLRGDVVAQTGDVVAQLAKA